VQINDTVHLFALDVFLFFNNDRIDCVVGHDDIGRGDVPSKPSGSSTSIDSWTIWI